MSLPALDQTIVVGPFQCNCRLLVCPETGQGALIDPGDEAEKILKSIQKAEASLGKSIQIRYLFHTHGHLDHIGGTRQVKETLASAQKETPPEIYLHRGDEQLYQQLQMQGRMFGFQYKDPLPVDHFFEEGQEISLGRLKFSLMHTPGHSPGSVCLRMHEDSGIKVRESLFSGDTLFQGSVGRTDLWGGDSDLMFKNIRTKILMLDEDTRVCPGHGPETKIGVEKQQNPFLV